MQQSFLDAYTEASAQLHTLYPDQIEFNIHMNEMRQKLLDKFGWLNASETWKQTHTSSIFMPSKDPKAQNSGLL